MFAALRYRLKYFYISMVIEYIYVYKYESQKMQQCNRLKDTFNKENLSMFKKMRGKKYKNVMREQSPLISKRETQNYLFLLFIATFSLIIDKFILRYINDLIFVFIRQWRQCFHFLCEKRKMVVVIRHVKNSPITTSIQYFS